MPNLNEAAYNKTSKDFLLDREQALISPHLITFADLLKPGDTILDVGCGGGIPNAKYLSDRGFKIVGIDTSEKMLERAKINIPEGNFSKANIVDFQTDTKFPAILAFDSLFHLDYSQHEKVFIKLYSLLKNGGYLLFTHGGSEGEISGPMHGENFFYSSLGPDKTKILLEKLGFKILLWEVDMAYANGYMVSMVRR